MNYATKYDILTEVMSKQTHTFDVFTHDLYKRVFTWENTNKLFNNYFIASKTGITPSAGPCLVTLFKVASYECRGCLIDSKSVDIRWKEMATI